MPIEKKQDLLLKSLLKFYKDGENMKNMINIVTKKSNISLRVLDYLCTNYAKKNDIVYEIGTKKNPFNMFINYRAQLKAYSKMQFDPFRRHNRIMIQVPKNIMEEGKIETTVAQLNFFKWAIENKVIDYLKSAKNLEKVENAMTSNTTKKISKSIPASTKRHNVHVTVTFK